MMTLETDLPRCTLGSLLARERIRRGITIEKAAKDTRMRVQHLRDMENDDLSRFSNPSYARMFLIAYSKYLGVSIPGIRPALPEPAVAAVDGYQYMGGVSEEFPSIRNNLPSSLNQRSRLISALTVATVVFIFAVLVPVGVFLSVNLPRISVTDRPLLEQGEKPAAASGAARAPMLNDRAVEAATSSIPSEPTVDSAPTPPGVDDATRAIGGGGTADSSAASDERALLSVNPPAKFSRSSVR